MSISPIPILPATWDYLVQELLYTNVVGGNLNEDDISWARVQILAIFQALDANLLYRNAILMDRKSKMGRWALYYARRLVQVIKDRDFTSLRELLASGTSPEFEKSNFYLTPQELDLIQSRLDVETLALNDVMEQLHRISKLGGIASRQVILGSPIHIKCQQDVCLWMNKEAKYEPQTLLLDTGRDSPIWVTSDADGKHDATLAWCFKLPELLILMLKGSLNPYTGSPFTPSLTKFILERYETERKIVQYYLEL